MYHYLLRSGLIHSAERQALEQQLTTFSRRFAEAASLADTLESRAKNRAEMQRAGTIDAAPDVLTSPVVRDMKVNRADQWHRVLDKAPAASVQRQKSSTNSSN